MVPESSMLPPFLRKIDIDPSAADNGAYTEAVFTHSDGLGSAHSIWWYPGVPLAEATVILFIPGNPGLAAFYTEYLSELRSRSPGLAILAHSHLAHTPKVLDQPVFTNPGSIGLLVQLKSAIEALDAIKQTLRPKNIVLIGHSLGGWLCLQVCLSGMFFTTRYSCFIDTQSPPRRSLWRVPALPFAMQHGCDAKRQEVIRECLRRI
jgi:pimeloyl-ACP methyl ester carboxylesterase